MKKYTVGVAILLAGLVVPFAVSQARPDGIKTEIDAANAEFARLFAEGDAAALAARYTENAQLMPPNVEMMSGQAAIGVYWKATLEGGASRLTLLALEVEQFGDTAIETGRAEIADAQGNVVDVAKYIVVWKRVGNEWKMHKDIFNSNLPLR